MTPEFPDLKLYLQWDEITDFRHPSVAALSLSLRQGADGEQEIIRRMFMYVRDHIRHSADAGIETVTLTAPEVLKEGHGICHAKAVLLAALLRGADIPCGFCYQKLTDDDERGAFLLHGMNAVWLKDTGRWLRLDARGNKPGVDAQFIPPEESLAWMADTVLGEADDGLIRTGHRPELIAAMKTSGSRSELWQQIRITGNHFWPDAWHQKD